MFDFIRTHRRWMQLILLLLVVPAFAFFWVEGYVGFMSRDKELAQVNGVAIVEPEFDAVHRARLDELRGMLGAQFDAQAIDTPAFRRQLLNEMIDQRVIATAAMQGHYSVSDEQLRQTIAQIPAVQVNGVFSPERYRQVLAAQGMAPADFELRVRSDLILSQVLGPIGATAAAPQKVVDELTAALTQRRTVALRRFNAVGYESDVVVTDADIADWYSKNADELRLPQSVDVEYVVIDEQTASRGITVSEADIEQYYEQNKSRYGQPEQRKVSHILRVVEPDADEAAKQAAKARAEQIANELKADPSKFAELAKTQSEDPGSASQGGDLGWISKDTLVPEVENAVFQMPVNTVSDVIESPFGYHVAIVTEIQPASTKPLSQVQEDVESEIKQQLASARFADLASQLTSLVYDQSDALAPIATQLDLPLLYAQGLARVGLLPDDRFKRSEPVADGQLEVVNNPKFIQTAFSAEVFQDKMNSGVIEIEPGTVVAMRIDQVNEPTVPPLEQVAGLIRERLVQEKSLALAREAGKAALAVISDGSQAPIGFSAPQVVTRQDAGNLVQAELDSVMRVPVDQAPKVVGIDTREGYSLLDVQSISAGEPMPKPNVEQFTRQLAQAWARAEERGALELLREVFDAHITPEGEFIISGTDVGTGT
jgi:peptidyl-prolyl cis-trans isomerase D